MLCTNFLRGISRNRMDQNSQVGAVRKLFEETRRRLVETGTRNRLIHVNRQNKRSNSLEIINEKSDEIYKLMASSGKTMRFLATGKDKDNDSDTPSLAMRGVVADSGSRFTDNQLETRLGPDGLQKRLLKLARDAKTAEEESGVNILFLAIGFLSWYEDESSNVKREAPLLLLPVELVRNQRTSTFDLRFRDEDISTNLPLRERLKGDFGIDLPEIEIDDDWTPNCYFDEVEETVTTKSRWSIDRDGMQLGFFSFAKLLMFRDLDPANWPDNALERHSLTTGLLYERFEVEEPMFGAEERLDERLPPETLYHVVDADSSQAKVIEEVRSGRNLVVQGPPGTGKSQTITNIIASAVRDGKRVLFVAEKMAALAVVHKRLVSVGLSDVCLELHSKSANKKTVLAELGRTLNAARAIPAMPEQPHKLRAARDRLNGIAGDLHREVGQSGESAFDALASQVHFMGLGAPAPTLPANGLADIHVDDAKRLGSLMAVFGDAVRDAGALHDHPFFGVGQLDLQPTDLARLADKLTAGAETAASLNRAINAAAKALGVESKTTLSVAEALASQLASIGDAPELADETLRSLLELRDKARLRENLEAGLRWQTAREASASAYHDCAWQFDATSLRPALIAGKSSFFARWGSSYRRASRELDELLQDPLPKSASDRTELADCLIDVAALRSEWRDDEEWCGKIFGDDWRGEKTPFQPLLSAAGWSEQAKSGDSDAGPESIIALSRNSEIRRELETELVDRATAARSKFGEIFHDLKLNLSEAIRTDKFEDADLDTLERKAKSLAANSARYNEWVNLQRLRSNLQAAKLEIALPALEAGRTTGQQAETNFRYARAEAIWKTALASNPALADLRNVDRHEAVQGFQKLEVERRRDCVKEIRARHLNQVPQGAQGAMGFVRGEIGKKKAHAPIRKLISNAAEAIQRIKPVFMMSPISVAQFLSPASIEFDLLLIDEASQVRPEDALGAIARAHQIVVVGDQKQLPPSSFFDRLSGGEDQDDEEEVSGLLDGVAKVGDLESILTLCEARGLSTRMLEWHYRSRDPSLIRVSNREFYGDGLILPPSPLQGDPNYGLSFSHVSGIYDRGGKRDNRIEAEALVKRVAEHARSSPDLSLGIVTFSFAQRNLITELLEYQRRQDAALDGFLREGGSEDVFVKNIENVQGDERDVILVSIGHGPSVPGGKPSMSFGPVNNEGGERRLNVLFTRARVRCEVFCSFDPGEMDLSKTKLEGPRVLKRFLDYAKTGIIDERVAIGAEPDTPFEADIAAEIQRMGFLVDHQVGTVGFKIDLGIRHPDRPGTYILAVECDGATYHSALWARERDRLRQEVLEHLGWNFHRIWSTDWFYRRPAELERLRAALDYALQVSVNGLTVAGANNGVKQEAVTISQFALVESISLIEARQRTMPPYQRAWVSMKTHLEPHEVAISSLARLAATVVETEGPIHEEEAARRIAAAFGKEKAGSRILKVTQQALWMAMRSAEAPLLHDGKFWFTRAQAEDPPVRDRSNETIPTTAPANISKLEIMRCLEIALEDSAGGADQDIIRAAARLFGFKRVGSELQARLQLYLEEIDH
jgi:Protein of unknown function (DUF4011)/REase_MTES_1575/Protein of unknown function (DUF3320)/AAA domain